eukprot:GHVN01031521.1.p1 GENE.GHVN01031521.1~~GHVN01031521.1.p1  ORF type:complete len:324 (+),score=8.90 GHVN01031521.1:83-1054(+)
MTPFSYYLSSLGSCDWSSSVSPYLCVSLLCVVYGGVYLLSMFGNQVGCSGDEGKHEKRGNIKCATEAFFHAWGSAGPLHIGAQHWGDQAAATTAGASLKASSKKAQKVTADPDTPPFWPPPPSEWPDRPLYLRFNENMKEGTSKTGWKLPEAPLQINPGPQNIAAVHEFETPLFKGRLAIRIAEVTNSNNTCYFNGRKRLMATCVQGMFKEPLKFNDVFTGQLFEKPFFRLPPSWLTKLVFRLVRKLNPGTEEDVHCSRPYIVSPIVAAAQTLNISDPNEDGCELPNLLTGEIQEDTRLLGDGFNFRSARGRRTFFSDGKAGE